MQRLMIPARGGHLAGLNFGRAQGPIDLVFLHATGFNALTYRQLLQPLADRFRVVALDLRGHGHTMLPARAAFLTHWHPYAADVVAAIRQLSRGHSLPRLIAGHSMGATTALLALAGAPDLAGALLMIDPAVVPPTWRRGLLLPLAPHLLRRRLPIARSAGRRRDHFGSAAEALASYRGRGAFKTWKPGFLDDYVEDGFAPQPDGSVRLRCSPAWESATFAGHRHDTFAALRALRVPARLMAAEKGSTTAGLLPMIAQAAPAMAIETVAGCTHFVPMERPELVRERMIAMMGVGAS
jgi:pimeloyl-ACP methyl ester carboxylesterase